MAIRKEKFKPAKRIPAYFQGSQIGEGAFHADGRAFYLGFIPFEWVLADLEKKQVKCGFKQAQ